MPEKLSFRQEEESGQDDSPEKGLLGSITEKVKTTVNESRLPTQEKLGFESTVGFYGGKLKTDAEGKFVYDMRGLVSKIDKFGDALLRTYDEHIVKNPIDMMLKHPKWFFRFLFSAGTKRYRGTPEEIVKNAERLGLGDNYGAHEWGVEIKNPEIFQTGLALQDIYRADVINNEQLNGVDRFQAVGEAAKYLSDIHEHRGAIGEVLPSDFIFKTDENGEIGEPVLNIPDIIYNEEKNTAEINKKATDLLDFLMSIGFEELRRSRDWNEAKTALEQIVANYGDKQVVKMAGSYARRGRLTLQGDAENDDLSSTASAIKPLFVQHNKARLNFDKGMTSALRELAAVVCESSGD